MSTAAPSEFARAMGPTAREILGEPNAALSSSQELRFGTRGSLSVDLTKGVYRDHETGSGGGVIAFLQERLHLDKSGAVAWLREHGRIEKAEPQKLGRDRIVATYDYVSADSELLFQVVRRDPKRFLQRRPDGRGGWDWKSLPAEKRVLYRLPAVIAAVAAGRTIYIAEGEKGVHAIESLGLVGTCSPCGAGAPWQPQYSQTLTGADVVILPDNDQPGQDHAADVARHLQGIANRVRVVTLPNLLPKADIADWVAAGGTAAKLEDLANRATADQPSLQAKSKKLEADPAALDGFDLNEDGVALAFAERFKDRLRYCHHTGAWFEWTGIQWRREETKLAFSWARHTCRQLAKEQGAEHKISSVLAKASTAAAVERFAQADRAFAVTSETWDRDPWLLGTPGGVVDLRTGELRPARPEDYITRTTAVAPSNVPDCPRWLQFLHEVTAGDAALIRFLQQWAGYCLTGDTREQALLFVHGPGGNGKGVFLGAAQGILGAYCRNASMETFTASQGDRHPTDLAMLKGARMVCASETEEGRAWAEVRIKQVTGGDIITARFMRQDFFEFRPQFKLTIIGNHKPVLRNVDEAARRRFNIVPFNFKPNPKDPQLEEKLRQEWPAILRWMIEGCLDWQRNGLVRPKVVVEATNEYFTEQDSVRQWIEECCDTGGRNLSATTEALFKSWTAYALANGEKPGTAKWFAQHLGRQGFEPVPETPGHRKKRGFLRIEVKKIDTSSQWQNRIEADDDSSL